MQVSISQKHRPSCAYCHDTLSADVYICDCGASYHAECLRELGKCATLGCDAIKESNVIVDILPEDEAKQLTDAVREMRKQGASNNILGITPSHPILVGLYILLCYVIVYGILFL